MAKPKTTLDTVGSRVRLARSLAGLSVPELAKKTGLGVSTIYDLERGDSASTTKLPSIADTLKVRAAWLESGDEPMAVQQREISADDLVLVKKVYGAKVSGGPGEVIWDFEEVDRSHAFKREWMQREGLRADRCKLYEVSGESMSPNVNPGDTIMINLADREIKSGEVYALIAEDGLRIKRLYRRADGVVEMRSDNPQQNKYPPEPITSENVAVIGRVVWKAGRV